MTHRLTHPYTTFKADGRDEQALFDYCMKHLMLLEIGWVHQLKYNATKYNWSLPYRIWVLRSGKEDFRFFDTKEQAKGMKMLLDL